MSGKTPNPEKTFARYWVKNGGDSDYFHHKDVVFECFHNFVAFSQWGNTLYNIMLKLGRGTGDAEAKAWFKKTMEGDPDNAARRAPSPRSNASSWSCSAPSRRMAEASPRFTR